MEGTKQLKGRSLVLVGFTLFSMFFGAGNLIFPPFMAAQAGCNTWPAMVGFAISAVGLPILGVVAVARSGGLTKLAGRVHPVFALIFTMLVYLSIGPCLAIPRTASTSFEMAVTPFAGGSDKLWLFQLLYSAVFFAVALLVALRPEKLTERLGKILCPCLLLLIASIFIGCVVRPLGGYGASTGAYFANPIPQGFLDGYQTMDTIAGLNFGIVIALNIRAKGVEEDKNVVRGTIRAGWIAGAVMLAVYAMLAHVGAVSGGAFPGAANGAETLTRIVSALFGPLGSILLAAIFVIACLNTCIGLISSCGEYFHSLVPRFSYRAWAIFFAVVSMAISNAGLNLILKVSVPVLNIIYPVAIVLIALAFLHKWIGAWTRVYPTAILFTAFSSVVYTLDGLGLVIPGVTKVMSYIPLSALGLGWLLPAAAGIGLGILISPRRK
ncbi:MAG: branched-chain amino acid transport system II carrier protein [Clostridia bacterium]|nr:branched-chain amino acid transport system II carrier protein [Clostridia bacterium]